MRVIKVGQRAMLYELRGFREKHWQSLLKWQPRCDGINHFCFPPYSPSHVKLAPQFRNISNPYRLFIHGELIITTCMHWWQMKSQRETSIDSWEDQYDPPESYHLINIHYSPRKLNGWEVNVHRWLMANETHKVECQ